MKQQWRDLLFLHWEADPAELRARIPEKFQIDTYQGKAYIALVPFDMKGVTGRFCPSVPGLSDFPEFNVRTYVTCEGKPGVWFFSLDITNGLAVWAAQNFFHLTYRKAEMTYQNDGGKVSYTSTFSAQERFSAEYQPLERVSPPEDSLDRWLTERYCLYTTSKDGTHYRGEIQHPQWDLHTAEVTISENTMLDGFTLGEMTTPLFCPSLDVVVYPLTKLQED